MRDKELECMAILRKLLEKCWDETTIWHKNEFCANKPSAGQCYVTSILLFDIFGGGSIVSGNVFDDEQFNSHYWYKLQNGREFDLTSDQFDGDGIFPVEHSEVFSEIHKPSMRNKRYLRLKQKLIREFFRNV